MKTMILQQLQRRPWWMNGLLAFCAFMTFIYLPWDVFVKPLEEDQEVWFGLLFTGWAAKAGALLHWLVYGAGVIGFWKMKPWLHPWAAVYVLQIALGMLVWAVTDDRGSGVLVGALVAMLFLGLAVALLRAKNCFVPNESPDPDESPQVELP